MEKPISLHKHRVEKLTEMVDEAIEKSDEEYDYINDELIDFGIQRGDVTLNTVAKSVWDTAKRMDVLEHEILKLKLIILEASTK